MANPNIVVSLTLNNTSERIAFNQSFSFTANEEPSLLEVTTLTTGSTTLDTGTIENPKYFAFSNSGATGSILIGFDGINYDIEVGPDDVALIRLRTGDKLETQTVQTVADASASLDGLYFTLNGESGSWSVWFDVDNSGTAEPAHGSTNSVEVTSIATDDTAAAVALAVYTDLLADTAFTADFDVAYDATVDDDLITITDKFTGNRTDIVAGTSTFTVTKTQDGGTGRSVYAKASSGTIEAKVSIMPG